MKQKDYDELSEYQFLEDTELGHYTCSLLCLEASISHGASEELILAVDRELYRLLIMFREKTKIVIKSEPVPNRVYSALIWLDD